uniref:Glycosyltransferase 2-like domain-containing protein n=1 Tax=viral metagenome TaxID=1070528 RepID=A0A6C0D005_9ZZZZ
MYKTVFSLTTIPSRIDNLWMTLHSLFNQTFRPDRIIVNVPHKSTRFNTEYIIPDFLQHMHNIGNIEIHRCDDYGPGTKLLGLFSHPNIDNDTVIFVFDDDRVYNADITEKLLTAYTDNNSNVSVGSVSGMLEKHQYNYYAFYFMGFSGYLTCKKFFTDDIFECTKLNIRYCDDHYLSYHILKNNYKIFGLEDKELEYNTYIPLLNDNENVDSLCRIEDKDLNAKNLIKECYKYYKERYNFDIEEYKKYLENI